MAIKSGLRPGKPRQHHHHNATTQQRVKDDATLPHTPARHRFSLDLVMCTLDHLSGDTKTILSCTLTSKAWYRAARRHIYHTISFDCPHRYRKFVRHLEANEEIGPLVRKLRVKSWTWCHSSWVKKYMFRPLANKLTNVESLEFRNVYPEEMWSFFPFTGVRELILAQGQINEWDFVKVIHAWPRLETLDMKYRLRGVCRHPARGPLAQAPRTLTLRHLSFTPNLFPWSRDWYVEGTWDHSNDFLEWLELSEHTKELRSVAFKLHQNLSPGPEQAALFLRRHAKTLEELTLNFPRSEIWQKYRDSVRGTITCCVTLCYY